MNDQVIKTLKVIGDIAPVVSIVAMWIHRELVHGQKVAELHQKVADAWKSALDAHNRNLANINLFEQQFKTLHLALLRAQALGYVTVAGTKRAEDWKH